jgi:hypothetical protein
MNLNFLVPEPAEFPIELKKCLCQQDPKECEQKLAEALVKKKTREAFKAWKEQHVNFVRHSPLMSGIDKKINAIEPPPKQGMIRGFVAGCVTTASSVIKIFYDADKKTRGLISKIEQHEEYDFTNQENFETIQATIPYLKDYVELGLLSKEKLIQALTIRSTNGHTPVHPYISTLEPRDFDNETEEQWNDRIKNAQFMNWIESRDTSLKSIPPLLEQFTAEDLVQIFSQQDSHGLPPLYYEESFSLFLPFLKNLPANHLFKILEIRSSNGHTLLENNERFDAVWPLVKKLPPDLFTKLLVTANQKGNQPLNFLRSPSDLLPCLEGMNPDQRVSFLSLSSPKIFKELYSD